jgi:hypothetical protein
MTSELSPETVAALKQGARDLIARRKAGHRCDRSAIVWAEQLLKNNPKPYNPPPDTQAEKDQLP